MITMKKLQILCVDNDLVQKMDLQIGNNIIGRGVVPGCDDSEAIKHAVTINLTPDNKMTITPHQISPCYMKSIESSRWQLLKLGTTVPIKAGDICSLVPAKCWFKVLLVTDKMDNDQEHVLKRKANDAIDSNMSGKKYCSESGEGDNLECDVLNEMMLNENNNNDVAKAKPDDTDLKDDNSSSPKDNASTAEQKFEEICGASSKDKVKEHDNSNDKLTSESQNTDQSPVKEEDISKLRNESKVETQVPTKESNVPTTATEDTPKRERCKYGEKCYRINSQHKAEFSHPGDVDYNISDNRKECPYGSRCYRKNPQHKMQFKHTSRKPRSGSKRSRKRTPLTVSSGTLSDLEDSSEEESVDESEYEPSSDADSLDDDDEIYSDKNGSEKDVID